jgi:hypothetical protein
MQSIQLVECGLGTKPISITECRTSSFYEEWSGSETENIRIIGKLDHKSVEQKIVVKAHTIGADRTVTLVNLSLSGTIVIELVRLTASAPWLSGVRVYFPDLPRVDIEVETKLLPMGLDDVFDLANRIKKLVVEQIKSAIGMYAVLPNRFTKELGGEGKIDPFNFRYPIPEGVLRVQVANHSWNRTHVRGHYEQARNRRARPPQHRAASSSAVGRTRSAQTPLAQADCSDQPHHAVSLPQLEEEKQDSLLSVNSQTEEKLGWWAWATGTGPDTHPMKGGEIEVMLGADTKKIGAQSVGQRTSIDLLVHSSDMQRQRLKITFKNRRGEVIGTTSQQISELLEKQHEDLSSKVQWKLHVPGVKHKMLRGQKQVGWVDLVAEYRQVPKAADTVDTFQTAQATAWSFGAMPLKEPWVFIVELHRVIGLRHTTEGTEHWASIWLNDDEKQDTACAPSRGIKREGADLLQFLGSLSSDVKMKLEAEVSATTWCQLLGENRKERGGYERSPNDGTKEAAFDQPVYLLPPDKGEDRSLMDSLEAARLKVTVWCKTEGNPKQEVGTAEWDVRELLKLDLSPKYTKEIDLSLKQPNFKHVSGARVTLRVQARPLKPTEDRRQGLTKMVQNVKSIFGGRTESITPPPVDEDGKEGSESEENAEETTLVCEPGEVGIAFKEGKQGVVDAITEGGKAEALGIKEGWVLIQLNDKEYTDESFKEFMKVPKVTVSPFGRT